jgi:hypothetical protein
MLNSSPVVRACELSGSRRELRFASTVIVHTRPMQSAVVKQTEAAVSGADERGALPDLLFVVGCAR